MADLDEINPSDTATEPAVVEPVKIADRPHRWTIRLSVAGLVISLISASIALLSWRESRANREIAMATSRAFVRVASAMINAQTLYRHNNPAFKNAVAHIVVSNTGRVSAKGLRVGYAVFAKSKNGPNHRNDGAIGQAAYFKELVPSASEPVRFAFPVLMKKDSPQIADRVLSLVITLSYNDGLSEEVKVDQTLMCGPAPQPGDPNLVTLSYCISDGGEYDHNGQPLKR